MEHESDDDTKCNKHTRSLENKRTSGDPLNYCIVEIGSNIEESAGNLKRLVVIQIPVKKYQLTQV